MYKLISTKGTRTVSGTLAEAVAAAKQMEEELQPSFGVTIEDESGETITEVRDGEDGEYAEPKLIPHDGGETFVCRDCMIEIDPVGGRYPGWTDEQADNAECPHCGGTDTAWSFADDDEEAS